MTLRRLITAIVVIGFLVVTALAMIDLQNGGDFSRWYWGQR